ncbi:Aflatoxin biosynthesis regulatory protein [Penicillium sp. IBT 18751x]|nr:Aflatoxin biosynthesis regulatory protein [Penicillium sp. IBT 18751x]
MQQSVQLRRDPTRKTGPPKLRSSCDSCGASKVKCDKGQPECGRCVSYGLPCAYGVSRKMGKPPRRPSGSRTLSDPPVVQQNSSHSAVGGSISVNDMPIDLEPSAMSSSLGHIWDPTDEDSLGNSILNFHNIEGPDHDLPPMPFVPDFVFGYNDGVPMDPSNINFISSQLRSATSSPGMGSLSSLEAYVFPKKGILEPGQGSITSGSTSDHECLPKLHEILESLSVLQSRKADPKALLSNVTSECITQVVPLDLILQLNRKATEGLASLVTCSCAKLPHVALLYVSIISQILAWYCQAAGCSQSMSPSDTSVSTSSAATGTSTPLDDSSCASAVSLQSVDVTVIPSRMAIGTFNVDDQHLQTATKIYLLSGEMKRVKGLMDQLRSQTDSSNMTTTGVDDVFRSVNAWLEWDYSRIFHMMQSKLQELNI